MAFLPTCETVFCHPSLSVLLVPSISWLVANSPSLVYCLSSISCPSLVYWLSSIGWLLYLLLYKTLSSWFAGARLGFWAEPLQFPILTPVGITTQAGRFRRTWPWWPWQAGAAACFTGRTSSNSEPPVPGLSWHNCWVPVWWVTATNLAQFSSFFIEFDRNFRSGRLGDRFRSGISKNCWLHCESEATHHSYLTRAACAGTLEGGDVPGTGREPQLLVQ